MYSGASELCAKSHGCSVVQSIIYYPHFTDGKTEAWSANSK